MFCEGIFEKIKKSDNDGVAANFEVFIYTTINVSFLDKCIIMTRICQQPLKWPLSASFNPGTKNINFRTYINFFKIYCVAISEYMFLLKFEINKRLGQYSDDNRDSIV